MKISLESKQGIQILSVVGEVTSTNYKILREGITKLMREGKNRIVIEFSELKADDSVLKDFHYFNSIAKELGGEVVIATSDQLLREKIKTFAPNTTPLHCFESKNLGFDYFNNHRGKPNELFNKFDSELEKTRHEVKQLQNEKLLLLKQIADLTIKHRLPPDVTALFEKISMLETQLSETKEK